MSADNFSRTMSGKLNKAFFIGKAIFYVEGDDDVAFFAPLKRLLDCRFESANGKPEVLRLAARAAEGGHPICVLLDDDFDVVTGRLIVGSGIVYVGKYSIENLLAYDDLLSEFVQDHCGSDDDLPNDLLLDKLWLDCGDKLAQIAVADLAADLLGRDRGFIPQRIESWLSVEGRYLRVNDQQWNEFQHFLLEIGQDGLTAASKRLNGLSSAEICADYLRGHLVFGLVRNRVFNAVRIVQGRSCQADNRTLLRLLSEIFWRGASDTSARLRAALIDAKTSMDDLLDSKRRQAA